VGLRLRHVLTTAVAALAAALSGSAARAQTAPATESTEPAPSAATRAVIGPVLVVEPAHAKGDKELPLRKVLPTDAFIARTKELDVALREAAQDLGLEVELGLPLPNDGAHETDLVKTAAAGHWVISPRIESTGGDGFVLRIIAVPPKSPTMLVRVEKVVGPQLATRAVVILRDFLTMKLGSTTPDATAENAAPRPDDESGRSRGRPILAASTTLFGLYTAYAIHKSAQSEDPRLLYPLLALGSGIGLGAALLAADEWNVTSGTAWTIAAGSWWGVVAGLSYASGRNVQPSDDRYAYGLAGGLAGTTVAITWVGLTRFDDGDAALVHSGAALGTLMGGAIDLLVRGTVKETPNTGIGIGAAAGFLTGGVTAAFVTTSANRVMLVDLGAGLGALGGASLASPLVFKNESETKTRLFLTAVLGGTVIGGTLGWLATREPRPEPQKAAKARVFPTIGPAATPGLPPTWTAGLAGIF
jgi:hypothetical protein